MPVFNIEWTISFRQNSKSCQGEQEPVLLSSIAQLCVASLEKASYSRVVHVFQALKAGGGGEGGGGEGGEGGGGGEGGKGGRGAARAMSSCSLACSSYFFCPILNVSHKFLSFITCFMAQGMWCQGRYCNRLCLVPYCLAYSTTIINILDIKIKYTDGHGVCVHVYRCNLE